MAILSRLRFAMFGGRRNNRFVSRIFRETREVRR